MTEQKLSFHNHPLSYEELDITCYWCEEEGGLGYRCKKCIFGGHKECIERSLNQAFHCQHPLRLHAKKDTNYGPYTKCFFCEKFCTRGIRRSCLFCKITVDLKCLRDPLPPNIHHLKCHKHKLTLLARKVSFTCNACGMEGMSNPYVCFECCLMLHKDCIYLPRVININRHDHRISRVSHLPRGNWECGVCRKNIDCAFGVFTCMRCPSYAVHSKCATHYEVWDGEELEDVPEEEELEDSFKVINENDIIHFSHEEHILRLGEDNGIANMHCDGCSLPINGDPFYKCVECNFCLHESCANLPRKKRHFLHTHKLTLLVDKRGDYGFRCRACNKLSEGFRYECREVENCRQVKIFFDIRCISIGEPFHHELHPHPLYCISTKAEKCGGCKQLSNHVLTCVACDYFLCMRCVTLPRKVKHRSDDHFLSLCQGVGNSSGDLWCDVCETKTDPSVWYYTCDLCGVTLHIECVLGEFYHRRQGHINELTEILPNNGASRTLCCSCNRRCMFPFFLKITFGNFVMYKCSNNC